MVVLIIIPEKLACKLIGYRKIQKRLEYMFMCHILKHY